MFTSLRDSPHSAVSRLTDYELRIAIAREVLGWTAIEHDGCGRITGTHLTIFTTFLLIAPDWPNDEAKVSRLESVTAWRATD